MRHTHIIGILGLAFVAGGFIFLGDAYGLRLTEHHIPNDTSIVVLSPHFDDAVLSLGGLLGQLGSRAKVVTFFTKENKEIQKTYWDEMSGFKDSEEAIRERTSENNNALSILGSEIENYSFNDIQYDRGRNVEELKKKLVDDIDSMLMKISGQVFVYGPAKFQIKEGNSDHYLLHDAFMEIIRKNSNSNITFFVYEDYPYVEQFSVSFSKIRKRLSIGDGVHVDSQSVSLNKDDINKKLMAMGKYSSQIKAFNILNMDLLGGLERFNRGRCGLEVYACEVVYQVKNL